MVALDSTGPAGHPILLVTQVRNRKRPKKSRFPPRPALEVVSRSLQEPLVERLPPVDFHRREEKRREEILESLGALLGCMGRSDETGPRAPEEGAPYKELFLVTPPN